MGFNRANDELNCAYHSRISDFMINDYLDMSDTRREELTQQWRDSLQKSVEDIFSVENSQAQIKSWDDCFYVCQREFKKLNIEYQKMHVLFEYGIKDSYDIRPDVLLISENIVVVCEFKRKNTGLAADIDQASGYGQKLINDHMGCRNKTVYRMLVVTEAPAGTIKYLEDKMVYIVSGDMLADTLKTLIDAASIKENSNIEDWIRADFVTRPDIIEAFQNSFKAGKIGEIKPTLSEELNKEFDERLKKLKEMAKYAEENKKYVLAVLSGVPGAGKTYVGTSFATLACDDPNNPNSIYLSGNGPLISVIKDNLKDKTNGESPFVKEASDFIYEYIKNGKHSRPRNIIVFDEAQRAWNENRMEYKFKWIDKYINENNKKGYSVDNLIQKKERVHSEAEVLTNSCEEQNEWCFLLIMIGGGQSIYFGEDVDLRQWNDAIGKSKKKWEIVISKSSEDPAINIFNENENVTAIIQEECLFMDKCIRSEMSLDTSKFFNAIIDNNYDFAKELLKTLGSYPIYLTRNLEVAIKYCNDFCNGRKFGKIASSMGYICDGFDNSEEGSSIGYSYVNGIKKYIYDYAQWYRDAQDDEYGCSKCKNIMTEFGCQGLEIDVPILGWSDDFLWNNDIKDWVYGNDKKDKPIEGIKREYRKNSYRVLLTRGRKGLVIFIPDREEFIDTYNLLHSVIGIQELPNNTNEY